MCSVGSLPMFVVDNPMTMAFGVIGISDDSAVGADYGSSTIRSRHNCAADL